MILTKATRLGAYVASAWLVCIALALVTTGHFFDVAVRDLELAVAAFVLAKLTEIRESSVVEAGKRSEGVSARGIGVSEQLAIGN